MPLKKRNAWKEISTKLGLPVKAKPPNDTTTYAQFFSKYVKGITSTRSGSLIADGPRPLQIIWEPGLHKGKVGKMWLMTRN